MRSWPYVACFIYRLCALQLQPNWGTYVTRLWNNIWTAPNHGLVIGHKRRKRFYPCTWCSSARYNNLLRWELKCKSITRRLIALAAWWWGISRRNNTSHISWLKPTCKNALVRRSSIETSKSHIPSKNIRSWSVTNNHLLAAHVCPWHIKEELVDRYYPTALRIKMSSFSVSWSHLNHSYSVPVHCAPTTHQSSWNFIYLFW